jgi:hypothetical protein
MHSCRSILSRYAITQLSLQRPPTFLRPRRTFMAAHVITDPSQVKLASVDLSGYDPEQSRLMEERCIVVDENDKAVGCADKKTCAFEVACMLSVN